MASRTAGVVVGAAMSLLFVFSAAVQLNDPDPIPWVAIYVAAAVVCAGAVVVRVGGVAANVVAAASIAVAIVATVWAASLAPDAIAWLKSDHQAVAFTMKTGDIGEELARECGGLTIVVVANVVVAVIMRRRRSPQAQ